MGRSRLGGAALRYRAPSRPIPDRISGIVRGVEKFARYPAIPSGVTARIRVDRGRSSTLGAGLLTRSAVLDGPLVHNPKGDHWFRVWACPEHLEGPDGATAVRQPPLTRIGPAQLHEQGRFWWESAGEGIYRFCRHRQLRCEVERPLSNPVSGREDRTHHYSKVGFGLRSQHQSCRIRLGDSPRGPPSREPGGCAANLARFPHPALGQLLPVVERPKLEVDDPEEVSETANNRPGVDKGVRDRPLRREGSFGASVQHQGNAAPELNIRTGVLRKP